MIKLVGLIFALHSRAFDLELVSLRAPGHTKLRESCHAPTPIDLVFKIRHADPVRDELVGQHLVGKFELRPLFERPVELLRDDTLPFDPLLGRSVIQRYSGQRINRCRQIVVSGQRLLFQRRRLAKIQIRPFALPHLGQVVLVERRRSVEH